MHEDAKQYLAKKARELDLGRADALAEIQKILNDYYPGQAKAKSIHEGVLKVATQSSVVASELRLNQVKILKAISARGDYIVERLHIVISFE